jgi:exoribonuclease R
LSGAAARAMESGLRQIRVEHDVPAAFPPEVQQAAVDAVGRAVGDEHLDRTDVAFMTLDPEGATDLDQAFAIEQAGSDIVLRYAIADVGWFVRPGDLLDLEAWRRGVTVYLPGARAPLYPPVLSEGAASLLPGDPRPAVVFVVRVAPDGSVQLDGVERSLVRSVAKLAYEHVAPSDLPDGFDELARRIVAAERERGAPRVEFPEQEVDVVDGGFALELRPRNDAEEHNAAMSLATNLAVAEQLVEARTGVFRVMPDVDDRSLRRLRHTARAFGLTWPDAMALDEFERGLPRGAAATSAFLLSVRRASGGASYAPYSPDRPPWHAAVAATYAHATAPLRRLQDRYVVEASLALATTGQVPDDIAGAFETLPAAMERGETSAARVERAVVDLAEAVVLAGRDGERFHAVVTDTDDRGARIQLTDPPVVARVDARRVVPGDDVEVRLVEADTTRRSVRFERVS